MQDILNKATKYMRYKMFLSSLGQYQLNKGVTWRWKWKRRKRYFSHLSDITLIYKNCSHQKMIKIRIRHGEENSCTSWEWWQLSHWCSCRASQGASVPGLQIKWLFIRHAEGRFRYASKTVSWNVDFTKIYMETTYVVLAKF